MECGRAEEGKMGIEEGRYGWERKEEGLEKQCGRENLLDFDLSSLSDK